jgi:hypothetical protein
VPHKALQKGIETKITCLIIGLDILGATFVKTVTKGVQTWLIIWIFFFGCYVILNDEGYLPKP